MGNLANIVLNDGQATPVAHTFEPAGKTDKGVFIFKDKILGIAIAYPTLSVFLRPPTLSSPLYKWMGKVTVPALEAASGANINGFTPASLVAYTNSVTVDMILHQRSTNAERKNIFAFGFNMLGNALIKSMPVDYVDFY